MFSFKQMKDHRSNLLNLSSFLVPQVGHLHSLRSPTMGHLYAFSPWGIGHNFEIERQMPDKCPPPRGKWLGLELIEPQLQGLCLFYNMQGPIIYYVPGGGGVFLKSVVFQN